MLRFEDLAVDQKPYTGKYKSWDAHTTIYEDGKHRRYELLFAVNGGAFAISKFAVEHDGKTELLKGLPLYQVAIGMIVFTLLMGFDILVFGMRSRIDAGEALKWTRKGLTEGTFSPWGQTVLGVICALIIWAWSRVLMS